MQQKSLKSFLVPQKGETQSVENPQRSVDHYLPYHGRSPQVECVFHLFLRQSFIAPDQHFLLVFFASWEREVGLPMPGLLPVMVDLIDANVIEHFEWYRSAVPPRILLVFGNSLVCKRRIQRLLVLKDNEVRFVNLAEIILHGRAIDYIRCQAVGLDCGSRRINRARKPHQRVV